MSEFRHLMSEFRCSIGEFRHLMSESQKQHSLRKEQKK